MHLLKNQNMYFSTLLAISPVDGRYRCKTESLKRYFSEDALIRYRILVEIEYFIALCNIKLPELNSFPLEKCKNLRNLYKNFSDDDAKNIKEIENYPPIKQFEFHL